MPRERQNVIKRLSSASACRHTQSRYGDCGDARGIIASVRALFSPHKADSEDLELGGLIGMGIKLTDNVDERSSTVADPDQTIDV